MLYNKINFPSFPYPGQIWPSQPSPDIPQYVWSYEEKAWSKYKIPLFEINPSFYGSINEGTDIKFLIKTDSVVDGTIFKWEIENITTENNDFQGSVVEGTVVITNNEAELNITTQINAIDEQLEKFRIKLLTLENIEVAVSNDITIVNREEIPNKLYSVISSSDSIIQGDTFYFYIFTQNVKVSGNSKILDWELSGTGLTVEKITPSQLFGSIELDSYGNAVIGFRLDNNILTDQIPTINLNFIIKDNNEVVSGSIITVKDFSRDSKIFSLTLSSNFVSNGDDVELIWSGNNLSSEDIIKMFSATDELLTAPIQNKTATGLDEGRIRFSNILDTNGVVFGYFVRSPENDEEKLLGTSNILLVSEKRPAPSPYPSISNGGVSLLRWKLKEPLYPDYDLKRRIAHIWGISSEKAWTGTFNIDYISGNKNDEITLVTDNTNNNLVQLREESTELRTKVLKFENNSNLITFTLEAIVAQGVTLEENKYYMTSFTLSSRTRSWTTELWFSLNEI